MLDDKSESLEDEDLESGLVLLHSFVIWTRPNHILTFHFVTEIVSQQRHHSLREALSSSEILILFSFSIT